MYPSKIILFGEYTVLLNSEALAIPFAKFYANWDYLQNDQDAKSKKASASHKTLKEFVSHLKLSEKNRKFEIDIDGFESDMKAGLFLDSNIPSGSGLGSSGALVAAVFDKYTKSINHRKFPAKLKSDLANLESYFHGSSSGVDPLVSLLNKAIRLRDGKSVKEIDFSLDNVLHEYNLFLIDSAVERSTGELVEVFRNKCKNDTTFLKDLEQKYIPINNACIEKLTGKASPDEFFPILKELSQLQLKAFEEMIPENISSLMKFGLESDLFYLKLCGSGGGGYYLGFTKDLNKTQIHIEKQGYPILPY